MMRGRKHNDPGVTSGWAISGHLDDWAEQAVDYVDGRADDATKAAIQEHLDSCPDCAARLGSHQTMLNLFEENALADPPASLEARVLEQVLHAPEAAQVRHIFARRRPVQGRATRQRALPAGPWIPAVAGAAAVVALVLALTISHGPVQIEETASTAAGLLSADATTEEQIRESGGTITEETTTTTPEQMAVSVTAGTNDSETTAGSVDTMAVASLEPVGPYVQDEEVMVTELAEADVPAYVFFDTLDGGLVTPDQADTLVTRFTSLTGLQLMDESLSSGVRTFAAYVPRENASAMVDLLFELGDSMDLAVCMSLTPGEQVTDWAGVMFEASYSLAELSASPMTPYGWQYTTSTTPPTTEGTAVTTKSTLFEESDTHILVVIFVAVQE